MALTAASMVNKIKAARTRLPDSDGSAQQANAQADAMLLALCQGIIDEVQQNSEFVQDNASPDSDAITGRVR